VIQPWRVKEKATTKTKEVSTYVGLGDGATPVEDGAIDGDVQLDGVAAFVLALVGLDHHSVSAALPAGRALDRAVRKREPCHNKRVHTRASVTSKPHQRVHDAKSHIPKLSGTSALYSQDVERLCLVVRIAYHLDPKAVGKKSVKCTYLSIRYTHAFAR
jgi:hypothetical protein